MWPSVPGWEGWGAMLIKGGLGWGTMLIKRGLGTMLIKGPFSSRMLIEVGMVGEPVKGWWTIKGGLVNQLSLTLFGVK